MLEFLDPLGEQGGHVPITLIVGIDAGDYCIKWKLCFNLKQIILVKVLGARNCNC